MRYKRFTLKNITFSSRKTGQIFQKAIQCFEISHLEIYENIPKTWKEYPVDFYNICILPTISINFINLENDVTLFELFVKVFPYLNVFIGIEGCKINFYLLKQFTRNLWIHNFDFTRFHMTRCIFQIENHQYFDDYYYNSIKTWIISQQIKVLLILASTQTIKRISKSSALSKLHYNIILLISKMLI